mmetsp:Transcript_26695/g.39359  ORF Transcript_26695/g.39359 Transcript_26695/m.39359 type:complete len:328 (+) Transcript_26695:178-1161(+)
MKSRFLPLDGRSDTQTRNLLAVGIGRDSTTNTDAIPALKDLSHKVALVRDCLDFQGARRWHSPVGFHLFPGELGLFRFRFLFDTLVLFVGRPGRLLAFFSAVGIGLAARTHQQFLITRFATIGTRKVISTGALGLGGPDEFVVNLLGFFAADFKVRLAGIHAGHLLCHGIHLELVALLANDGFLNNGCDIVSLFGKLIQQGLLFVPPLAILGKDFLGGPRVHPFHPAEGPQARSVHPGGIFDLVLLAEAGCFFLDAVPHAIVHATNMAVIPPVFCAEHAADLVGIAVHQAIEAGCARYRFALALGFLWHFRERIHSVLLQCCFVQYY